MTHLKISRNTSKQRWTLQNCDYNIVISQSLRGHTGW